MPRIEYSEGVRKKYGWTNYYQEPTAYAYDGKSIEFLLEKKKHHYQDRELFLKYQKDYGREDRELGKYFRDAASEEMKAYRGCCYALGILACEPPGDCKGLQGNKELAPYIDNAFAAVDLEWCNRNLTQSDIRASNVE